MPEIKDKASSRSCLILFLLVLPLLDSFGMVLSWAGPYAPLLIWLGLVGFICAAVIGAYVSVRLLRRPWYSSCIWATCGLLGMCLPPVVIFAYANMCLGDT